MNQEIVTIDLGSNSFRVLKYDCKNNKIISEYNEVVGMADGLVDTGIISKEAMARVIKAISHSIEVINYNPQDAICVTTAAMRKASNNKEVLKYFKDEIGADFSIIDGNEEASNASMETDDSGVLLQNVTDTKGAIGYVALSYLVDNDDVDTIAIDGVEPTLENTYRGDYKVWTFEHMYTNGEPDKATKAFLDYIMGEKFGKKMESLGYGVSSKMEKTDH